MTFRVREGQHKAADGTVYQAGDEFDSDKDLSKAFPEKFQLLDGDEDPDSTDEGQIEDTTKLGGTRVKDTRRTRKSIPTRATTPARRTTSSTTKAAAEKDDEDDDE